jgi:hypothetical protein
MRTHFFVLIWSWLAKNSNNFCLQSQGNRDKSEQRFRWQTAARQISNKDLTIFEQESKWKIYDKLHLWPIEEVIITYMFEKSFSENNKQWKNNKKWMFMTFYDSFLLAYDIWYGGNKTWERSADDDDERTTYSVLFVVTSHLETWV